MYNYNTYLLLYVYVTFVCVNKKRNQSHKVDIFNNIICTHRRLIVSPVKNNDTLRLNVICSSSDSDSLLLSTSSPNIIVRV